MPHRQPPPLLIVVPLTMSMEILAEAASALVPGKFVIGMRDIHAHHWIKVDEAPVSLQISAKLRASAPGEVEVEVRDSDEVSGREGSSPTPPKLPHALRRASSTTAG